MKKIVCFIVILIICLGLFCGCNKEIDSNRGTDPRVKVPQLAYKGESLVYDINDVSLTFYCGSENAGNGINSYKDYPVVTYIYFANDKTYEPKYVSNNPDMGFLINRNELSFNFADGLAPKNLYSILEANQNFNIYKKILSSDENSFYKNNTVTLQYKDTPLVENKFAEEDLWGSGSALYKVTQSYTNGIFIPDISYEITIPKDMFTKDVGYLFFDVASFFTEDYETPSGEIYTSGQLLEHRTITLYYAKEGSNINLSNYFKGETNNV